MKAIGYVRISTENQTGEDAYGLELAETYEDHAFSGCLEPLARPGVAMALEALKGGGIDRLVVYPSDLTT